MLFKITNGQVAYGATTVLEEVNFEIREREKIALVGRNGCGKTTLLKVLTGEVELSDGTGEEKFSVARGRDVVVGYLKQNTFQDESLTLVDEILGAYSVILDLEKRVERARINMEENPTEENVAKFSTLSDAFETEGGYVYKKEYESGIRKFGFTEEDKLKKLSEFSGGQRTKIALLRLVLSKPDVLLLDEPTNHLDVEAIEWLQEYVKNYKKSAVIVSHDRMFLDKTVDVVYEIEYGVTKRYPGNYTSFTAQKRQNYEKQLKDHDAQRKEIERLNRIVERFRYKPTKASMALSKLKMIERMKIVQAPNPYDLKTFHADFQPEDTGVEKPLEIRELEVGYDASLARISLEIRRGQKLAVIGNNGVGKSTLLKTIAGVIPALAGRYIYGVRVKLAYFDQQSAQRTSEKTVFDDFYDEFPRMNETEVRTALGAFGFSGEDVFKTVSSLSGGEKVKLQFCKLLRRKPNFLLLDEPTNHLDIVGKETLEDMLRAYQGTVIFVSHDRYFVNRVCDSVLEFNQGSVAFYKMGYEEYLERRSPIEGEIVTSAVRSCDVAKPRSINPGKERAKKEARMKRIETILEDVTKKLAELNAKLETPEVYTDYLKIKSVQDEIDMLTAEQDGLTDEYFALGEELEELRRTFGE